MTLELRVTGFERRPYEPTLAAMREFTAHRNAQTLDEIWLTEHPPVFTQGLAGKPEHLLDTGAIPVVKTERGGQVTYHGPGQVLAYLLLDLQRRRMGARALVCLIEDSVIQLLRDQGVRAVRKANAPGVYVADGRGTAGAKIAALGLKVSRGCSYHGVALNVAMDLEPFSRINPCGYPGLPVTDLHSEIRRNPRLSMPLPEVADVAARLGAGLAALLQSAAVNGNPV